MNDTFNQTERVLHVRRDMTGQWQYQITVNNSVRVDWQYAGFTRDSALNQARDRFGSYDRIAELGQ